MISLAAVTYDFKEPVPVQDLNDALRKAGQGTPHVHRVEDSGTDSYVLLVCSEVLTKRQVQQLWDAGDLWLGDRTVWIASSFGRLLEQVKAFADMENLR